MLTRSSLGLLLAFGVVGSSVFIGCGRSDQQSAGGGGAAVADSEDDYNPHDVPITEEQKTELRGQTAQFADALTTLKQLRDEVEQETAGGIPANPHNAHQALDKADLVLRWLPETARNSDVAKEHWEAINTAANELRTFFEQVHQNIDNRQDPDFAAVADAIDQKLAGLEAIPAP